VRTRRTGRSAPPRALRAPWSCGGKTSICGLSCRARLSAGSITVGEDEHLPAAEDRPQRACLPAGGEPSAGRHPRAAAYVHPRRGSSPSRIAGFAGTMKPWRSLEHSLRLTGRLGFARGAQTSTLTPSPRLACLGHSTPPAAPQRPQRGYFIAVSAVTEPRSPRAIAFIDGQNLYHAARRAGRGQDRLDPHRSRDLRGVPRAFWRAVTMRCVRSKPAVIGLRCGRLETQGSPSSCLSP